MDTNCLQRLATETAGALGQLWDAMGVPAAERAAFLEQITADVAAIYSSRVASQEDRKAALEAEIEGLRATIGDMLIAMEEAGGASGVVSARAVSRAAPPRRGSRATRASGPA